MFRTQGCPKYAAQLIVRQTANVEAGNFLYDTANCLNKGYVGETLCGSLTN